MKYIRTESQSQVKMEKPAASLPKMSGKREGVGLEAKGWKVERGEG